jgi:NADH dehydrogenase [ubiquinone] 1 alpha subcomplex assembly factor 2
MRRIVKYPRSVHYSEIKIPPQWHQWLRHTRQDAPSIAEQEQDVVRRENLKILAAQADARWAAKASFLDHPGQARGQALPATEEVGVRDLADGKPGHTVQGTDTKVGSGMAGGQKGEQAGTTEVPGREQHRLNERVVTDDKPKQKKFKEDPWKKARGGPSEEWQPEAWDGNIAPTKRR